jgi:peptide-methionine (S)-S-oxide reductase
MTSPRKFWSLAALAVLPLASLLFLPPSVSAASATPVPAPAVDEPAAAETTTETAVLAGGCFWGVQGVFQHVDGVTRAVSGYSGGDKDTAHYSRIEEGDTGHAESVEITYDPRKITYGKLLQIYFSVAHDPTELNRQGPDSGTQYRSAIFAATPEQQKIAAAYIAQLDQDKAFRQPLATRVEPFKGFFPAEAYHQDFLAQNPTYPYIAINDLPKVRALAKTFPELYRDKPVLVGALTD